MLFNYLMIKNYPNKQDKYVYPLIIHEKDKDRVIVTYNKDNNGYKLRSFCKSQHQNVIFRQTQNAWFG